MDGASGRIRTCTVPIRSRMPCSSWTTDASWMVGVGGFEPPFPSPRTRCVGLATLHSEPRAPSGPGLIGTPGRIRTYDPPVKSRELWPLSYGGIGADGESRTRISSVAGQRSAVELHPLGGPDETCTRFLRADNATARLLRLRDRGTGGRNCTHISGFEARCLLCWTTPACGRAGDGLAVHLLVVERVGIEPPDGLARISARQECLRRTVAARPPRRDRRGQHRARARGAADCLQGILATLVHGAPRSDGDASGDAVCWSWERGSNSHQRFTRPPFCH